MKLPLHHLRVLGLMIRDVVFRPRMDSPIFLVGCPHSGTTLLARIIGAHHNIYMIPGETNVWVDYRIHKPKWFARTVFRLCDAACRAHGKQRWIEKTTWNVLHIDKIFQRYPMGKVIWIIRDGRDTVASLRKKHDIEKCIKWWKDANEAMEPWKDDARVCLVRYEDLIIDYDEAIQRIMGFLGMSVDPIQQHYHLRKHDMFVGGGNKEGSVYQYRNWQTNKPLTDCRGRWKSLSEEDKQKINEEIGPLLTRHGYELCS